MKTSWPLNCPTLCGALRILSRTAAFNPFVTRRSVTSGRRLRVCPFVTRCNLLEFRSFDSLDGDQVLAKTLDSGGQIFGFGGRRVRMKIQNGGRLADDVILVT